MVDFLTSADGVTADQLRGGFFVGWPSPPSPEQHLAVLKGSQHAAVAVEDGLVIGFVTVLSDGVLMASVPLLEVLPEHQGRGIGRTLMEVAISKVGELYQLQLCCDDDVRPFYERLGFQRVNGMVRRL
jgi:GNAT superfamily N-acetyltransferase